jgi:uncharacterized protein
MNETTRAALQAIARQYQQHIGACHRYDHTERVVVTALQLARAYPDIDVDVLEAAAWLHDIGRGTERLSGESHADASARLAKEILAKLHFTDEQIQRGCAAILDHRYSSQRSPSSWEGRLLQDADRLDALGAIGIARTFSEGKDRALYHVESPFPAPAERKLDDTRYTLDHFFTKLLTLADSLHTPEARQLATRRLEVMRMFLREFAAEIAAPLAPQEEVA